MKKQTQNTPTERKMKFAEAGVMFVLVLALTVFIGVKVATRGGDEELVTEPAVVSELTADSEPAPTAAPAEVAEATHPDESSADSVVVEEAVVIEAPEPRAVTYTEAEKAYFDRSYDEAADLFGIYTTNHPANAWGFYMLGLSEWKAGDTIAAEDAFTSALVIKPDHAKSLINLGRVLLEQGREDAAKQKIELALAANPSSTAAKRVLGRIQHSQGQLAEAAASYETVLRAAEDDAWSLNNLGLIRIQQGRYEEALPALAKAVEIDPTVACFQNNLGVALERTGHFTAAGEAYAAALENDEDYEKADNSLARVSGRTEEEGLMPVDLAALAAGFSVADDMEVAAADPALDGKVEDEFPVENPAPARGDDDTPEN